jgi:hypothetical protein
LLVATLLGSQRENIFMKKISFLLLFLFLVSCNKEDSIVSPILNDLNGKWIWNGPHTRIVEFKNDGTFYDSSANFVSGIEYRTVSGRYTAIHNVLKFDSIHFYTEIGSSQVDVVDEYPFQTVYEFNSNNNLVLKQVDILKSVSNSNLGLLGEWSESFFSYKQHHNVPVFNGTKTIIYNFFTDSSTVKIIYKYSDNSVFQNDTVFSTYKYYPPILIMPYVLSSDTSRYTKTTEFINDELWLTPNPDYYPDAIFTK